MARCLSRKHHPCECKPFQGNGGDPGSVDTAEANHLHTQYKAWTHCSYTLTSTLAFFYGLSGPHARLYQVHKRKPFPLHTLSHLEEK